MNIKDHKQALEEIREGLDLRLAVAHKNHQELSEQIQVVIGEISTLQSEILAVRTLMTVVENEILRQQTDAMSQSAPSIDDQVANPKQRVIKGISPQSLSILKHAFETDVLPMSIEECLERGGSDWRMRKILISSAYQDGKPAPIKATYEEDLTRGAESRIRIQLAKDWETLFDPSNESLGLPCLRLRRQITEHSSTEEQRVRMFSSWGLDLNT